MTKTMTLNVRVTGALSEFVAANVGADGFYENVGEYVRDLIRRDKARADSEAVDRLKAILIHSLSVPDSAYHRLDAEAVIARNAQRPSA